MIEDKIDQLIAALDRNTAAQGGTVAGVSRQGMSDRPLSAGCPPEVHALWKTLDPNFPTQPKNQNNTSMIEDKIDQLIAALDRNTAAQGGTVAEPAKRTRGKAATQAADPASTAPAADAAPTKEQLVAAAEALRDAGGVETIRKIATANKVERVSAAAGTPAAAPVLKALQEALAEIKKGAI